jgi:hypothetical protein
MSAFYFKSPMIEELLQQVEIRRVDFEQYRTEETAHAALHAAAVLAHDLASSAWRYLLKRRLGCTDQEVEALDHYGYDAVPSPLVGADGQLDVLRARQLIALALEFRGFLPAPLNLVLGTAVEHLNDGEVHDLLVQISVKGQRYQRVPSVINSQMTALRRLEFIAASENITKAAALERVSEAFATPSQTIQSWRTRLRRNVPDFDQMIADAKAAGCATREARHHPDLDWFRLTTLAEEGRSHSETLRRARFKARKRHRTGGKS